VADVETLKTESSYLLGDLAEQLADASDAFSKDATQLLKFHGSYQQDDRDVRKERAAAGLGKAVSMMVRAAIPGGVLTAEQYLACDALADEVSNGTLRITTRQGLQWHLVGKHDLTQLIATLNDHLLTTLAACGDVARNVCACPAPLPGRDDLLPHAERLAVAVRPRTSSYWDLWLDGERRVSAVPDHTEVPGHSGDAVEPLYGPTYLPRKFKVGFAHAGDNCVDVYTHDVGLVPVRDDAGAIDRFVVLIGGGLGMTHNKPATYPRLASPFATVTADELVPTVEAIITVQRDHGDRDDRKHARLKYLVEERGVDGFRAEVEARLGRTLDPPEDLLWDRTDDHLGWHAQDDEEATWFLGVPVPSGRIQRHHRGAASDGGARPRDRPRSRGPVHRPPGPAADRGAGLASQRGHRAAAGRRGPPRGGRRAGDPARARLPGAADLRPRAGGGGTGAARGDRPARRDPRRPRGR
jgi:sulfite reductase (ferredoxin)